MYRGGGDAGGYILNPARGRLCRAFPEGAGCETQDLHVRSRAVRRVRQLLVTMMPVRVRVGIAGQAH